MILFDEDRVALQTLVATKLRERAARGAEPALPGPDPEGEFADLPPIRMLA